HAHPHRTSAARDPLGQEGRLALRARLGHGALPHHELALRVGGAAVESAAALRPALDELARAARLRARDPERDGLGRLALRIPGAGDELPEAAVLDDHRLPARRARLVGRLVLHALVLAEVARVLAVRVRRAREKLAEATATLEQRLAALGARLARL